MTARSSAPGARACRPPGQRVADPQRARLQIDVVPAQGEQLALPAAGPERGKAERPQPVVGRCFQERRASSGVSGRISWLGTCGASTSLATFPLTMPQRSAVPRARRRTAWMYLTRRGERPARRPRHGSVPARACAPVCRRCSRCARSRSSGRHCAGGWSTRAGRGVILPRPCPRSPHQCRRPCHGWPVDGDVPAGTTHCVPARCRRSDADVVQEPTEQPWGVRDCAVRDPAGNLIRIQELR